jgi:uncharacterized protein YggE
MKNKIGKTEVKNMKKQNNGIVITSIIAGVILIISFVAMTSFGNTMSGDNTVNVQGTATIKAMPDLITIYFNVETKEETSTLSKDENSKILNDLIDSLIEIGFERKDLVTENFNVYQNYDWTDDGRAEDGFITTHSLKIELSIEEEDRIGEIVDAGIDAGALVKYINFELTQESQNKYKAEAMKLAAQDATVKAESVAEGFEKKVGKLVNVNVNDFAYYPWNVYSAKGGIEYAMEDSMIVKEAASNIQVGEREISASVSAVFKLR